MSTRFSLAYAESATGYHRSSAHLRPFRVSSFLMAPLHDIAQRMMTRRQLRVIEIKMTAEASPGYFAEVAYYSMALAGWLADRGLDQSYVVVPRGGGVARLARRIEPAPGQPTA